MSQLPAEQKRKSSGAVVHVRQQMLEQDISAFESDTQEELHRTAPRRSATIVYSICAFFIAGIAFCAVAKIDRVVVGEGRMVSVGGQMFVSPLSAGIVNDIKVKTGDVVKQGDVLAVLDPTIPKADLAQISEKLQADEAKRARLLAEQAGTPMACDGRDRYLLLECSLWRQRQSEYRASLTGFEAQIGVAQANIETGQSDIRQYDKRVAIAKDVEGIYSPLAREGYVSKLQMATTSDSREELRRQRDGRAKDVQSLQKTLANARAQRENYVEGWRSAVEVELVQVSADIEGEKQGLEKARKQLELTQLTAPQDGVVLRVGKISTGSVADRTGGTANQDALITLAPLNQPLEAEVAVLAKDIGFIRVGDPVSLRLGAYSYVRHGTLDGHIRTISEGSFTTNDDNQQVSPFFKVRVTLGEKKLRGVPADFRLLPGLTLDADILVGKRTILSYVVEGMVRTGSEAMREAE